MTSVPTDVTETASKDVPADDPLEAAEREAELVVARVRDFLARLEASDAARFHAMAALLETVERVVPVLEEATSPGQAGRMHVFAVIELLITSLDRLAPAAAHALMEDDPHVRKAAAQVIRTITTVPAIAASARRAAQHHPDPVVREALATAR